MATGAINIDGESYIRTIGYTTSGNPIEQGNLSRIKEQSDYNADFTYLDEGTADERVSTIVHSSATLGISSTETFTYAGGPGQYRVSNIAVS